MVRVVRLGAANAKEAVPAGEEGEIAALLAGDESSEGYWRRPEADAAAIRGGWYFTGDTGRMDADGDVFVTGRVDDLIITGGENVSPVEIESCLSLHPAVAEVAVAGLSDERWGKIVCAFVKRRATAQASSTPFAKARGLLISSAHAATNSSVKSRNPRSVNCFAASSSPANTSRSLPTPPAGYDA
jgi:acyl-coenzyme A synthetase/AMP-(fatty) acid ligase